MLTGRILACEFVKNACIRFNSDLEREDISFSEQHYLYCAKLIENLTHTVGEKAGENFILEPWQHFIVANIFGFLKLNGTRRFTRAYVELPRKNGKSTFAAALMLFGLIADGEEGAQIYSAATKLDQAMMVFGEAYRMVTKNKIFAGHLKSANSIHNRYVSKENSIFKPLEWNPKKQDGLNAHFCCIDEYHAHLSDEMYNVMRNSMGARAHRHSYLYRRPRYAAEQWTQLCAAGRRAMPGDRRRQDCQRVRSFLGDGSRQSLGTRQQGVSDAHGPEGRSDGARCGLGHSALL